MPKPKLKQKMTPCGCAVMLILFVAFVIVAKLGTQPGHNPTHELLAYSAAKEYVREALGPLRASADFPLLPEVALNLGDGRYKFSGTVDYSNVFGAKLQANWVVVVQQKDGKGGKRPTFDLDEIAVYD